MVEVEGSDKVDVYEIIQSVREKVVTTNSITAFVMTSTLVTYIVITYYAFHQASDLNTRYAIGRRIQQFCAPAYMFYETGDFRLHQQLVEGREIEKASKLRDSTTYINTIVAVTLVLMLSWYTTSQINLTNTKINMVIKVSMYAVTVCYICIIMISPFYLNKNTSLRNANLRNPAFIANIPIVAASFAMLVLFIACKMGLMKFESDDRVKLCLIVLIITLVVLTFLANMISSATEGLKMADRAYKENTNTLNGAINRLPATERAKLVKYINYLYPSSGLRGSNVDGAWQFLRNEEGYELSTLYPNIDSCPLSMVNTYIKADTMGFTTHVTLNACAVAQRAGVSSVPLDKASFKYSNNIDPTTGIRLTCVQALFSGLITSKASDFGINAETHVRFSDSSNSYICQLTNKTVDTQCVLVGISDTANNNITALSNALSDLRSKVKIVHQIELGTVNFTLSNIAITKIPIISSLECKPKYSDSSNVWRIDWKCSGLDSNNPTDIHIKIAQIPTAGATGTTYHILVPLQGIEYTTGSPQTFVNVAFQNNIQCTITASCERSGSAPNIETRRTSARTASIALNGSGTQEPTTAIIQSNAVDAAANVATYSYTPATVVMSTYDKVAYLLQGPYSKEFDWNAGNQVSTWVGRQKYTKSTSVRGMYALPVGSTSTIVGSVIVMGDVFDLNFATGKVVNTYIITRGDSINNVPIAWVLAGSTDGKTWNLLDAVNYNTTNHTFTQPTDSAYVSWTTNSMFRPITNTIAYTTYRVIIMGITGANSAVEIRNVRVFGPA
jgi:hypothetical protein